MLTDQAGGMDEIPDKLTQVILYAVWVLVISEVQKSLLCVTVKGNNNPAEPLPELHEFSEPRVYFA